MANNPEKEKSSGLEPIRFPKLYLLANHPITAIKLALSNATLLFKDPETKAAKQREILRGAFGAASQGVESSSNSQGSLKDSKSVQDNRASTYQSTSSITKEITSNNNQSKEMLKGSTLTLGKENSARQVTAPVVPSSVKATMPKVELEKDPSRFRKS